ncbi:MAG: non-canonical purine NTP pyrophosphatase [Lautropia sp.]|nr:non-canonical purine NTP pyrophosphatase [Lautropia sp.]
MSVGQSPENRWVLASGNPGKAREFQALLGPLGVALVTQKDLGIADADEPHSTFVENAIAKARHACACSGLVALADDSGICVPALGGAPGVRSARYSDPPPASPREQVDEANSRKLILQTAALTQPVACFYYCVVVLMRHPEDPRPMIAEGVWHGVLAARPRGRYGFGYDPHFLPAGVTVTAAEMEPAEKNRISHRARAIAGLAAALGAAGKPVNPVNPVNPVIPLTPVTPKTPVTR